MKELLKLLTVALAISATYAEDVVAKADAKPETTKDAAVAKDAASVEVKEEKKADADAKHDAPAAAEHKVAHAEPVVHVNRKAANDLTMRLSKDQSPWKGPMATIPVPACCAADAAKPAAVPHHKAHAQHAHKATAPAHKDDHKKTDAAKDTKKTDAKPEAAKEEKKDDHKAVADSAAETTAKAVETVDTAKTAAQH